MNRVITREIRNSKAETTYAVIVENHGMVGFLHFHKKSTKWDAEYLDGVYLGWGGHLTEDAAISAILNHMNRVDKSAEGFPDE